MATTHVQNQSVFNNTTNPIALAYPSAVTAGSMLFAMTVDGLGKAPTGITDTLSNTWTQVAGGVITTYAVALWKAGSPSGGANTVSVAFASLPSALLSIWEFSGMGATTNGASNTLDLPVASATDPITCATLSPTSAGVVFCGLRLDANFTYVGWADSFVDVGGAARARTAYRILTSGASVAPTLDVAAANSGESLTAAVYEAANGVAAGAIIFNLQIG